MGSVFTVACVAAASSLVACSSDKQPAESGSGGSGGSGGSTGGTTAAGGAPAGGHPGSGGTTNAGAPGTGGTSASGGTGGSTGGAGGSVSAGTGGTGTSGSGGAGGSAGAAAGAGGTTGGSAGSAGSAGMTGGSAGASGTAGAGGAAGSGTAGSGAGGSAGGGSTDCASLPLCDDFEATATGAAPNSALWKLVPSSASGSATVDSMGAHGSQHSLKVVSPDRLYLRNTSVIGTLGPEVHVRFYLRLNSALAQGHGAMIVTHPMMTDEYSQQNELRFGSQDNVFHWNTDSDAANIPDVSPNGDAKSFKPEANKWYCVELTINTNGHLNAAIDGTDVPGLTADGMATPDIDQTWVGSSASLSRYMQLADFNFGWQSYGGGALTLWYDDVAISSSPIGCQ